MNRGEAFSPETGDEAQRETGLAVEAGEASLLKSLLEQ